MRSDYGFHSVQVILSGNVIRNHKNKFMRVACKRMVSIVSMCVAEAYAIRWGLQLAQALHLEKILILSNALYMVNCVHGLCTLEEVKIVVEDCGLLATNFKESFILFVGRKFVVDAHHLVWIGKVLGSRSWDGFIPSFEAVCNFFPVLGV